MADVETHQWVTLVDGVVAAILRQFRQGLTRTKTPPAVPLNLTAVTLTPNVGRLMIYHPTSDLFL
jgi:hypothetical protein